MTLLEDSLFVTPQAVGSLSGKGCRLCWVYATASRMPSDVKNTMNSVAAGDGSDRRHNKL